ncbi:hypothetical protein PBAL39_12975 [Pedobacter sp. BAL39]|uniref:hypothetical protein n=1 Tax=Pedobacter sp. BAL39 TaxID=391596 RepID=UPI0001559449|nr:hypothetical protein [Pedobacter sp. BAL39]EDM35383.1 hypothetical protein PBAL39_12975 [Pedobacter sp. BAL39]
MNDRITRLFEQYGYVIYLLNGLLGLIFILIALLTNLADKKNILADSLVGLGVNILSVSVVFLIVERFFSFNSLKHEKEQLQELIGQLRETNSMLTGNLTSVKVHTRYPTDLVRTKVSASTRQIRIAGSWPKSTEAFPSTIDEALRRDVSVKVIYLNPNSVTAQARLKSMMPGTPKNDRTSRVAVAFSSLRQVISRLEKKDTLEIKLSEVSLSFRLIACDSWFLIGFYWYGKTSAEGTHFEFDKNANPELVKDIMNTFDTVFNDTTNISFT